jgi:hypothetical protein
MLLLTAGTASAAELITRPHIERRADGARLLLAFIEGKEVLVADRVLKFWVFDGGKALAYSGSDGAGGYEGEGESLRVYQPGAGPRKVLAEYYAIDDVQEATTATCRKSLIVASWIWNAYFRDL